MTKGKYEWDTSGLGDAVKKAKRVSLLKTVVIALLVTIFVTYALYAGGSWALQKKIESVNQMDVAIESIWGANIESGGASYTYSFLTAVETRERQKIVEGIPISWGTVVQTIYPVGNSQKQLNFSASGYGVAGDGRPPLYFNGERLMEFYYPDVSYEKLPDDRNLLEKIGDDKVAELGLSFDRSYTLDEVSEFLPGNPVWLWVDTGSDGEEPMPVDAESAVGFRMGTDQSADSAARAFIMALEFLNSKDHAVELYQKLSGGEKNLKPQDLRITGAVVTGSTEELAAFENLQEIRAVTMGATVDRY